MDTKLYDSFFKDHYKFIKSVVNKSGIPSQEVEDVTSEIILKILAKDGIGRFDPTRNTNVRSYIARYAHLTSLSYRSNFRKPKEICESFGFDLEHKLDASPHIETDLLTRIKVKVEGDALTFLQLADQNSNYRNARKVLSDEGWSKSRITAAVREVRRVAKQCINQ